MTNDFAGKRLLILGGSIQCLKVVTAAKKLGIYTIVTDMSTNDYVAEAADEVLPYSVMAIDELYQYCKENPVDGVLNFCVDFSQHSQQILCEKLGFPSFGTKEQYDKLTDKTAFKELCLKNNIDVIPTYDENDLDKVEYPVLVKPAEGSGSRGQSIAYNREELLTSMAKAKDVTRNGNIILEKYMGDCQDFTVTFIVIDGTPCLIRIGDRHLGKKEDGLNRQCICTVTPSAHVDFYFEKAHDNIVNMIKGLGIQNAPVFFQGFLDKDTVRLYDPGFRFPGGEYDRLYREITGIDTIEAMVKFALTGKIDIEESLDKTYLLNGKAAVQLTVTVRPGTICEYSGFDEIRAIPNVICVAPKSKVGAVIKGSGDIKQRVVEIDFVANNKEEAKVVINDIYSKLRILDENGEDMVVSKVENI